MNPTNFFLHKDVIAFDLEFNQPSQNIIQIGYAHTVGRNPTAIRSGEIYVSLHGTDTHLSQFIIDLTGITDEVLKQRGVSLRRALFDLNRVLQANDLFPTPITWGSGDLPSIKRAAIAHACPENETPWQGCRKALDLQALVSFQDMIRGEKAKRMSLSSACDQYRVKRVTPNHNAKVDAINTLNLFLELYRRSKLVYDFIGEASKTKW